MEDNGNDNQDFRSRCQEPIELYLNRKVKTCADVEYFKKHDVIGYFAKELKVDLKNGLSLEQVKQSEKLFGRNFIKKKPLKSYCQFFKDAISDDMMLILIGAAVISIILQALVSQERSTFWIQGTSILLAVAVCSVVASTNDYQKQSQFLELSQIQEKRNHFEVIRGGQKIEVHRQDIVTGEIVVLEAGIEVPVDGFLVEAIDIIVDESPVTGESQEVYKDIFRKCANQMESHPCPSPVIISSSKIMSGEGKMMSVVVGPGSQFGKIQELIHTEEEEQTPLEQKLGELATKIGYFGLYSAIFVFAVLCIRMVLGDVIPEGWNTGKDLAQLLKYLIIAVTIVVVAIPEGLPLAVTLSLAFSVKKMLSQHNLVRKLMSCQTMGGANYICTDKTGTLTENKMWILEAWSGITYTFLDQKQSQFRPSKDFLNLILNGIHHNTSASLRPQAKGSPTEIALLQFAEKLAPKENYEKYRIRAAESGYFARLPFNSDRKRMSTGVVLEDRYFLFTKGASQIILDSCQNYMTPDGVVLDKIDREQIQDQVNKMAAKGLRVVALAYKEMEGPGQSKFCQRDILGIDERQKSGFTLLMAVGMKDTLRPETVNAIRQCKKAGINIIMVTGDSKVTAQAIAEETDIITSQDLQNGHNFCVQGADFVAHICQNGQLSPDIKPGNRDQPFLQYAEGLRVLARSRPSHKYLLIQCLKKLGHVVAVTGDGTNDVPALLKADVGFAMGISGTQIARNAADIIILDDNFNSLVNAVVWGRNIYDSIRKFLQFQLTVNLVAVGLSIISAALIRQSVLSAIQMLWVNLIMDSLASLALATEPPNKEVLLNRLPHSRNQSLISSRMVKHIAGQAIFQFACMMVLLFLGQNLIPEQRDSFDLTIGTDFEAKYNLGLPDAGMVVNGAFYKINGDDAYFIYFEKYHMYSRHFTFIFNTFVMMQIFNFVNCRRIHDELNLFEGLFNNWIYLGIVMGIFAFQIVIVEFLSLPFKLYSYGLTPIQWALSVLIGASVIPVSIFLRVLPFGKEATQDSQKSNKEKYSPI